MSSQKDEDSTGEEAVEPGLQQEESVSSQDGGESTASTGVTTSKVSVNDASMEELEAAFEAAGISNAGQWAHEVDECRPYPVDDPGFQKLRGELQKYNPAPGVIDAILALLELP